jgi:hypothetical protein
MGLLMQAFGVDGQTAAGLLAQFWEKGIRGSDEVSKTLDNLYAQFAVGSVSVADVAKVAPKLFSTIADQGPVAIAQMGAFLQIFAKQRKCRGNYNQYSGHVCSAIKQKTSIF